MRAIKIIIGIIVLLNILPISTGFLWQIDGYLFIDGYVRGFEGDAIVIVYAICLILIGSFCFCAFDIRP